MWSRGHVVLVRRAGNRRLKKIVWEPKWSRSSPSMIVLESENGKKHLLFFIGDNDSTTACIFAFGDSHNTSLTSWNSLDNCFAIFTTTVSDRYSDTTNIWTITHREISHADNQLYHRNKGWVYRIWQLINGARATVPTSASCDLTWQSETFDNRLWIMYFRMSFSVPSLKQLLARFLHHREATSPCYWMPDICCHSCFECWRVLLICWVGCSLNEWTANFVVFRCGHPRLHIRPPTSVSLESTGHHQPNGAGCVFIRCMVFQIQLFWLMDFRIW